MKKLLLLAMALAIIVAGGFYVQDMLMPASAIPADTSWMWTETRMADRTTVTPNADKPFVATFSANGRVSISGDCNAMNGTYTAEDDAMAVGPLMSTKMFCEGSKEVDFANHLMAAGSVTIEENTMTIGMNGGGTMIFVRNQ